MKFSLRIIFLSYVFLSSIFNINHLFQKHQNWDFRHSADLTRHGILQGLGLLDTVDSNQCVFDADSVWLIRCRFIGERNIVSLSMPHNF